MCPRHNEGDFYVCDLKLRAIQSYDLDVIMSQNPIASTIPAEVVFRWSFWRWHCVRRSESSLNRKTSSPLAAGSASR